MKSKSNESKQVAQPVKNTGAKKAATNGTKAEVNSHSATTTKFIREAAMRYEEYMCTVDNLTSDLFEYAFEPGVCEKPLTKVDRFYCMQIIEGMKYLLNACHTPNEKMELFSIRKRLEFLDETKEDSQNFHSDELIWQVFTCTIFWPYRVDPMVPSANHLVLATQLYRWFTGILESLRKDIDTQPQNCSPVKPVENEN